MFVAIIFTLITKFALKYILITIFVYTHGEREKIPGFLLNHNMFKCSDNYIGRVTNHGYDLSFKIIKTLVTSNLNSLAVK